MKEPLNLRVVFSATGALLCLHLSEGGIELVVPGGYHVKGRPYLDDVATLRQER